MEKVELTADQLKAKLEAAEAALKAKDQELSNKNLQLKAQEDALKQQQQEAATLQDELVQQIENLSVQKSDALPVVSIGKDQYQVLIPRFQLGDDVFEAKNLESNSQLVKDLVAAKSGVLQKISK
jgi:hypothetical protein